MGTIGAGGISSGVYTTDSAAQVKYLVNDSATKFYFAENEEQLDKILEVRGEVFINHNNFSTFQKAFPKTKLIQWQ